MSAIGPGNIGPLNIASSFAGAQRNNADADRVKERGSEQAAQVDREAITDRGLNDVTEADSSSDRDPDGRMPYGESVDADANDGTQEEPQNHAARAPDAAGDRGRHLDLDA